MRIVDLNSQDFNRYHIDLSDDTPEIDLYFEN